MIKIRPRMLLDATIWQGEPVEGFDRVNGEQGFELLISTLDGSYSIKPGDWIVSPRPGYSFGVPATMFDETYEVVGG